MQLYNIMLVQRTESPMMLKCELCSYYTKTCFGLNRHTKMMHGSDRTVVAPNVNTLAPNVADVKCSTCYKTFSKRSNLTRHIPKCLCKSHQLACARCQQVFSHRSALSRHKKTCSKAVQISDESDVSNDSESESSHTENRAF